MISEIIRYIDKYSVGDVDAKEFAEFCQNELKREYPDAKITVNIGFGSDYIGTETIQEQESVEEFIQALWDRFCNRGE